MFIVESRVHTMRKGRQSNPDASAKNIQSAVQALASGDFKNISNSTLETILDLVHYPEHLRLLVNPQLTPALLEIVICYPINHSVGSIVLL